jgi:predicted PurR-regulated permease PerM
MSKKQGTAADEITANTPALPASPVQVRNVALTLLSFAIAVGLLQWMQSVLIPIVLSGLLFYALDPAVDRLQRMRVPRALGAAVVLLVVVAGCGALAYSLEGEALTVIDRLPAGARRLAAMVRHTPPAEAEAIEKVQQAADALQQPPKAPPPSGAMRVQIENPGFQAGGFLLSRTTTLIAAANQLVILLFLTYFMLLSDQLFKRKLVEIVDTLSKKKVTINVLDAIATQIEQFLLIQILTSAVVALVTWGALRALGLEQAALWGLVAGVFNSIPYYGPVIVTAVLAAVGFLQFGSVGMAAAVAGVSLLITTLEGMLLTPMLVGRAASMNQIAIFTGLLFWSWIWGVWGMLLAVPMMMVIKVICDHIEPLQPVGHLLGE